MIVLIVLIAIFVLVTCVKVGIKVVDCVIELFTGRRGDFNCSNNFLTSLTGSPKVVNDEIDCSNNNLTSLKGCPEIVNDNFYCHHNKLTSLEGCPEIVNGHFNCSENQLTSLKGCPKEVGGNFNCSLNPFLEDISDIPYDLKSLDLIRCPNIKIFPKHIKDTLIIALDEEVLARLKEQTHLEIVEVEEIELGKEIDISVFFYHVTIRERSLS